MAGWVFAAAPVAGILLLMEGSWDRSHGFLPLILVFGFPLCASVLWSLGVWQAVWATGVHRLRLRDRAVLYLNTAIAIVGWGYPLGRLMLFVLEATQDIMAAHSG